VPTTYRVVLGGSAKRDVQAIHDYIARDKPDAAAKWVREFHRRAKSLRQLPQRFELIPEVDNIGVPFRHLLHYSHRIIYLVDDDRKQVTVMRVIHGARNLDLSFFQDS